MSTSCSSRELDPLLKDLGERTQSFRRNVVSLAAELKDVRSKLSSQEQLFAKETQTRQTCCRDEGEEHGGGDKTIAEKLGREEWTIAGIDIYYRTETREILWQMQLLG